nr:hypothetical protein Iba_scaffold196834CG0010 [Ipomoea batatas]
MYLSSEKFGGERVTGPAAGGATEWQTSPASRRRAWSFGSLGRRVRLLGKTSSPSLRRRTENETGRIVNLLGLYFHFGLYMI